MLPERSIRPVPRTSFFHHSPTTVEDFRHRASVGQSNRILLIPFIVSVSLLVSEAVDLENDHIIGPIDIDSDAAGSILGVNVGKPLSVRHLKGRRKGIAFVSPLDDQEIGHGRPGSRVGASDELGLPDLPVQLIVLGRHPVAVPVDFYDAIPLGVILQGVIVLLEHGSIALLGGDEIRQNLGTVHFIVGRLGSMSLFVHDSGDIAVQGVILVALDRAVRVDFRLQPPVSVVGLLEGEIAAIGRTRDEAIGVVGVVDPRRGWRTFRCIGVHDDRGPHVAEWIESVGGRASGPIGEFHQLPELVVVVLPSLDNFLKDTFSIGILDDLNLPFELVVGIVIREETFLIELPDNQPVLVPDDFSFRTRGIRFHLFVLSESTQLKVELISTEIGIGSHGAVVGLVPAGCPRLSKQFEIWSFVRVRPLLEGIEGKELRWSHSKCRAVNSATTNDPSELVVIRNRFPEL